RRLRRPVPARLRCAGGPLPGAAGLRGDGGGREAGRRRAHLQGARRERHDLHALPGDLLGARLRHVHRPLRDALDGQLRQAARSARGGARAPRRLGRTRLRVTRTPLACAAPHPMVSSVAMTATDAHRTIDAVWRIESARLIFIACHPLLSTEARTALTLRLLAGLTTEEIARAFLVPEPTIAQRIVRAKRTLSDAHVPFEIPRGKELAGRLSSVLEVIYLVFNEGYSATAGEDWMRPALCEEALRIGRILAELAPLEPEVHGLGADHRALRRARAQRPVAGRGAQPRGGRRHGLRARGGTRAREPAPGRGLAPLLSPAAERARRSSRQARPLRGSARRV